jgi:hypothetical protein
VRIATKMITLQYVHQPYIRANADPRLISALHPVLWAHDRTHCGLEPWVHDVVAVAAPLIKAVSENQSCPQGRVGPLRSL